MTNPICSYCGKESIKSTGDIVYPHREDLKDKIFYECLPCEARVGCHNGTDKPLGSLANLELRRVRSAAHGFFDDLWRKGHMSRNDAYIGLAFELNIPFKFAHIGQFNIEQSKKTIIWAKEKLKEFRDELLKRSEGLPEEENIQDSEGFVSLFGDKK